MRLSEASPTETVLLLKWHISGKIRVIQATASAKTNGYVCMRTVLLRLVSPPDRRTGNRKVWTTFPTRPRHCVRHLGTR